MDHFQLAAIQAVDYFSIFFRQLEIKLYKNKAMNFNLFQSRDSRRFFSRVSVLPELKYIFICRLRDGHYFNIKQDAIQPDEARRAGDSKPAEKK